MSAAVDEGAVVAEAEMAQALSDGEELADPEWDNEGELEEEELEGEEYFDEEYEEGEDFDDEDFDDEEGEDFHDAPHFPPLYTMIVGPLHTVGQHGDNIPHVRKLLLEGADVNQQTPEGWTPLMVSGSSGQPDVMSLLLAYGADILVRDHLGNGALEWTEHRVRGHDEDVVLTVPPGPTHMACATILRLAGEHWSPANHHLFPKEQRRTAVQLLLLGRLLMQRPADGPDGLQLGLGFFDVWVAHVMPHAIERPEVARNAALLAMPSPSYSPPESPPASPALHSPPPLEPAPVASPL
mmetsp:Transcript_16445/g.36794  ORF Transcript_16445/g.36794 Transcript_16445/m.36794 type:complete len:296 (-) Transcript_16445:357-1244(-)|eukprot:CAMPEP_0181247684 /NCGR_PEP_ID=MMETSP1096-20121128/44746_1 /TAXON_ID=156174 ORGANISM="Chrysochromulina ericina, Strain CCMP281" /NCGR_SAMPLE_ID=MMETSP1096 /ASSEMBLY_ACC=CAM_ASM_000453 /LENGTH=295 /DNA_ID=CAMNT_0023344759 /DNA_START=45 /DNA_END=932 /DNA_ORIENTATION=+